MYKTAAVIAEFNPFHNGHKYLLTEIKKNIAKRTIVIMSGSFVQRGDIAITDKWTRTKDALMNGADLVIELPVIFSMNTAQKFAYGAISTLNGTGVVDTLSFGSESGNIAELKKAAYFIAHEPPEISQRIKHYAAQGYNFPTARKRAFEGILNTALLDNPNDILGIEYIRAIIETNSTILPTAIVRSGTNHDSEIKTNNIASASEIRKMLRNHDDISAYIPNAHNFNIYNSDTLSTALIAKIRTSSAEQLQCINDITEGLENKFIKAASNSTTFEDLCMSVKSKRYTLSRIRRIAFSILLNLDKTSCSLAPSYIRVLGMNDTGKEILRDMKKKSTLPVIIKPADYKDDTIFTKNCIAEDIFSLCSTDKKKRTGGNDKKTSPVIL